MSVDESEKVHSIERTLMDVHQRLGQVLEALHRAHHQRDEHQVALLEALDRVNNNAVDIENAVLALVRRGAP